MLKAGGEGLLNELCLAEHCGLGDNIVTSGHDLPVEGNLHCLIIKLLHIHDNLKIMM